MAMNNNKQWKDWLTKLPNFEPEEQLWDNIEAALDFDQRLNSAIDQLPTFTPDELLWNKLQPRIKQHKTKVLHLWQRGVAASVLLAVVLTVFLFQNEYKHTIIIESEVIVLETKSIYHAADQAENKAIDLINKLCETNQTVCNGATFKEKINLYNELKHEEAILHQTISSIGESPEMVKALIRIENMKSKTIQELVTLINS